MSGWFSVSRTAQPPDAPAFGGKNTPPHTTHNQFQSYTPFRFLSMGHPKDSATIGYRGGKHENRMSEDQVTKEFPE